MARQGARADRRRRTPALAAAVVAGALALALATGAAAQPCEDVRPLFYPCSSVTAAGLCAVNTALGFCRER